MMEPKNYFTFDGVTSKQFKCYTNGNQTFGGPEADIETMTIPGKSGDLLRFGNRYANSEVAYDCWIAENMRLNLRDLRSYLLSKTSYARLEDTYNPDEFRLAVYSGGLSPNVSHENGLAEFTITFNCKPQRYLKSGETQVTITSNTTTISNPSFFPSKPLIRIEGSGTLTVGHKEIVVKNNDNNFLMFDCEIMDAYTNEVNRNADVETSDNDFVVLESGSNLIKKTSGITKVVITPRWYYL